MAELRIGDADREAAVAELGEHFALGRLTHEEHAERTEAAWSARTRSDLAPLFADLPGSSPVAQPAPGPGPVARRARTTPPVRAVRVALGALLVLAVVTHLPVLLLVGGLWFYLSRRHGAPPPPWVGRGRRVPPGVSR